MWDMVDIWVMLVGCSPVSSDNTRLTVSSSFSSLKILPPGVNQRSFPGSLFLSINSRLPLWLTSRSTQGRGIDFFILSYSLGSILVILLPLTGHRL